MSTSTVRWIGLLGLGLAGVAVLVFVLRRSDPASAPPGSAPPGRERRVRPGRADLPAASDPRGPGLPAPAALPGAMASPPPPGQGTPTDAGVAPPDRFAPPEDQFTFNPRLQARLSQMGASERRVWTEKLIVNLENRVKAVDGRIAQHEAEGNAKAAHGERITRGRITDGIAALRRQLARLPGGATPPTERDPRTP